MHTTRPIAWLMATVIAVSAATLAAPPAVLAAGDQLQTHVDSTYELQPQRGVVHVTQVVKLTNKKAGTSRSYACTQYAYSPYGWYAYTTQCTTRTNYYYYRSAFYLEKDAVNVKVRASSGSAKIRAAKPSGEWRLWKVDYSNLYYGKSRTLTISYDLKGGGPRSDDDRRVGWAYSRFCMSGGSGDTGRVRAVVPEGYLMVADQQMTSTTSGGARTFDSGKLKEKPWAFYACLNGSDPTAVATSVSTLPDGTAITVEAWKGDDTWAASTIGAVEEDLPALAGVLGQGDLPRNLTVREGLADGYQEAADTLLVSERTLDREGIVGRLASQAWFPSEVFPDGWIASGYLAWARHEAGIGEVACSEPAEVDGALPDLGRWSRPPDIARGISAVWAAQQEAACWVVRSIADAIGQDRMLETLEILRTGGDAWAPGDAAAGPAAQSLSWERWLDVVTERGLVPAGADAHLAADLLVAYGVADDADAMTDHEAVRDAYHAHRDATGGVPAFIVDALRDEDTEAAGAALGTASEALATAASVEGILSGVETDDGPVATAVAGATCQEDLDAAGALAARQVAAAEDVAAAFEVEAAPRDALQSLGLLGAPVPDHALALAAVASGDDAVARTEADAIRATIGGARDAGTQRAAVIAAVIAAVLLLLVVAVFLVRRRSRRPAPVAAVAAGDPSGPPSPPAA